MNLPVSIKVDVRPASVSNSIEVEYRVGAKRSLPRALVKHDTPSSVQFVRAFFTVLPSMQSRSYLHADGACHDLERLAQIRASPAPPEVIGKTRAHGFVTMADPQVIFDLYLMRLAEAECAR